MGESGVCDVLTVGMSWVKPACKGVSIVRPYLKGVVLKLLYRRVQVFLMVIAMYGLEWSEAMILQIDVRRYLAKP